jgi:hypothetical protein
MMSFFRSSTLLLLASSSAAASSDVVSSALDAHVQEIIGWVRNQGGIFNQKIDIRRADPADPSSYFGVFATENIYQGEELMIVPSSAMIWAPPPEYDPDDDDDDEEFDEEYEVLCELTHALMEELKLGEESKYAPFVSYLKGQERGQIPATWTEPAKELISEIVSIPDRGIVQMASWMEEEFEYEEDDCIEPGNAFEQQALALVIQRGWDSVLIPIYDMINHTNDLSKRNTDNSSVHSKGGLRVWASRAIEAGEEILASYDDCTDCFTTPDEWGTPEILRDFGFVEAYPRAFYFREAQALFSIDEVTIEADGETHLEIEWFGFESPSYEGINWMKEEYQRLQDIQLEGTLEERRHLMPEKEWNTIFQYHQALTAALDAAIQVAIDHLKDADEEDDIGEVDGIFHNIDDGENEDIEEEEGVCDNEAIADTYEHDDEDVEPSMV